MAAHSTLTGADLHEPKGVAAASANTIYVANGAGSGTWQKINTSQIDNTLVQDPNTVYLSAVMADVSTASFIIVPAPEGCTFVSARVFLANAITLADAVLTFTRNDGSSFGPTLTITQAGSAEGTSFIFSASTNTSITNPGYVKIASDGGSTTACAMYVICKFTRVP